MAEKGGYRYTHIYNYLIKKNSLHAAGKLDAQPRR